MQKLTDLVEILVSLKKVSKSILKNMLPLMKILTIENNDLVDEVVCRSDAPVNIATDFLQNTSLSIIADAEHVKKEIDLFAETIEISQKDIKKNIKKFPFLAEAWFGDMFDNISGLEALKLLLEELKIDKTKASEDWLIEFAVTTLATEYLKK